MFEGKNQENLGQSNLLITELNSYIDEKQENDQTRLAQYIENIDKKLGYAEWKQNLVLQYNYMPLSNIKERIQIEKDNYRKKMAIQQKKVMSIVQNPEYLQGLVDLKNFRNKLQKNIQDYEKNIIAQKLKNNKLLEQKNIRRQKMKHIMKNNMLLIKQKLVNQGCKSKKDLIHMYQTQTSKTKLSTRKNSIISFSDNYKTQKVTNKEQPSQRSTSDIFKLCINAYLFYVKDKSSLSHHQKMRDIQGSQSRRKLSDLNSHNIANINGGFKSSRQNVTNKNIFKNIEWQQFRQLAPKQILQCVLERQKSYKKIQEVLLKVINDK